MANTIDNSKKCKKCNIVKAFTEFTKNKRTKDKMHPWCKDCANLNFNNYYYKNCTELRKKNNEWKINNPDKVRSQTRKWKSNKIKTDPLFRLSLNVRNRLAMALKAKKWNKTSKFNEYIGCSLEDLKIHLETQFKKGMTWDNWGHGADKWNIDHIIPISSANNEFEIYKLSHYTNLQPLWHKENRQKWNKVL